MGMLLMLLTIAGLLLAACLYLIGVVFRLPWLRKFVGGGVAIWLALYLVALVAVSASSSDALLKIYEPKAFCGFYFDCHLHAMVTDVTETGQPSGNGRVYIVTVKVFSDARRAALRLSNVKATVYMDDWTKIGQLDPGTGPSPWDREIGPGESYETRLMFSLPESGKGAKLLLTEGAEIERIFEMFLIGDEDSIFHGKQYFDISRPTSIVRKTTGQLRGGQRVVWPSA